jgi:DNA-binding response OmpR family regulator
MRVLLVEDDISLANGIQTALRSESYTLDWLSDGRSALHALSSEHFDVVVLDLGLPKMDGLEVLRSVRDRRQRTPVLILTARDGVRDRIAGLDAGADDYVTKPIKPKVLLSRIKALLRRHKPEGQSPEPANRIVFDDLIIDKDQYIVIYRNEEISLPKKEFELLNLLCSRPNKVFTRDEIFSQVWGDNVIVGDRTIDVHVRKIREKTGLKSITTVKGVGYKYET